MLFFINAGKLERKTSADAYFAVYAYVAFEFFYN